jgi:hypothetical protein
MLNGGETTTSAELDCRGSAMEVAVTVMLRIDETEDRALYVAVVVVTSVKAPPAVPVTPVPEAFQVTPLPLGSFSTVAVNFTLWP